MAYMSSPSEVTDHKAFLGTFKTVSGIVMALSDSCFKGWSETASLSNMIWFAGLYPLARQKKSWPKNLHAFMKVIILKRSWVHYSPFIFLCLKLAFGKHPELRNLGILGVQAVSSPNARRPADFGTLGDSGESMESDTFFQQKNFSPSNGIRWRTGRISLVSETSIYVASGNLEVYNVHLIHLITRKVNLVHLVHWSSNALNPSGKKASELPAACTCWKSWGLPGVHGIAFCQKNTSIYQSHSNSLPQRCPLCATPRLCHSCRSPCTARGTPALHVSRHC